MDKFTSASEPLGVPPDQIVSLKLRDVVSSYSEYGEMLRLLTSEAGVRWLEVQGNLQGRGYLVDHEGQRVLLVEHERGIEILYIAGSIASLIGIIPVVLQCWGPLEGILISVTCVNSGVSRFEGWTTIERVFRNTCHSSDSRFYDRLVTQLFENVLHRHTTNRICISRRGTSDRQEPLEAAVNLRIRNFEAKWRTEVTTDIKVLTQTPVGGPCLQVIDYMNWAVYRAFVESERRYYKFVEDKVSLLVDLYDSHNYPKNWHTRGNPFDTKKASPL